MTLLPADITPAVLARVRASMRRHLAAPALLCVLLLPQALFAQTSRMDNLTFSNPAVLGFQAHDGDVGDNCCQPRLSHDGRYVLMAGVARNLVAGDYNDNIDLFVRDRVLETTRRVNVRSDGGQGRSGDSVSDVAGAISADGDLVVFHSRQFDLVDDDDNSFQDLFLHELSTGTTTRLVKGIGNTEPDSGLFNPSLSADGRFIVFHSDATNLVAGHLGNLHIYLLDRQSGILERISVTPDGTPSLFGSVDATVSDDGRFVAFLSSADDLVGTAGNGSTQLFVRDRQLGVTQRLSENGGVLAESSIFRSMISGDGSSVVFDTEAGNLDPGDSNGRSDVYVAEIGSGTLTRVSVTDGGVQSSEPSRDGSISRDGRRVSFHSGGVFAPGGTSQEQVYLRDLDLQTTILVSVNNSGFNGNADETDSQISGDGQVVAFAAASDDLVVNDTNFRRDRFVRDLLIDRTERVSLADSSGPFPAPADGSSISSNRGQRQLSADARFITVGTDAKNLGSTDISSPGEQIVRIDRQTNSILWVSAPRTGPFTTSSGFEPAISANGRFVVFRSSSASLVPGDNNNAADVFWFDAELGVMERVNLGPGDVQGLGGATTRLPSVSDDGDVIAFVSNQTNLVSGDTNTLLDIFVRDRFDALTTRVSVSSTGEQANGASDFPVVSANGRYVVFTSIASNLVADDDNGLQDVFRHDRLTGETVLVSQSSSGQQSNDNSFSSAISADGSMIAFSSFASNLVADDSNGITDIFVRDLVLGTTTRVSVNSAGQQGNGSCASPSISADGRIVSFVSIANNLAAADTNNFFDLFRHDRETGQTTLLSIDPDGRQAPTSASAVSDGQTSPDGSVAMIETSMKSWQLSAGIAGSRGMYLATPLDPESVFGDGFE